MGSKKIRMKYGTKKSINRDLVCIMRLLTLYLFNTASSEKGTTLKVANSEFQFFGYYVMGPYE